MRRRRFPQSAAPVQIGPQRAAIYARVSTLSQKGRQDEDDKLSLEGQEVKCRLLCREQGYEVNEAYVVREVSSGANLFRPQLEEVYSAMKRGEIDVLVMYNVSRFARDDDNATYQYIRATKRSTSPSSLWMRRQRNGCKSFTASFRACLVRSIVPL